MIVMYSKSQSRFIIMLSERRNEYCGNDSHLLLVQHYDFSPDEDSHAQLRTRRTEYFGYDSHALLVQHCNGAKLPRLEK